MYYFNYISPLGEMIGLSDGKYLQGLYFVSEKSFKPEDNKQYTRQQNLNIFLKTTKFLDQYFSGKTVDSREIPVSISGTEFRKKVWKILYNIPYGKTVTYKEIAEAISLSTGKRTSARAVGNAVGHNPIRIIIPCHRVIGANGNLTGYAWGLDRKKLLLNIESKKKL